MHLLVAPPGNMGAVNVAGASLEAADQHRGVHEIHTQPCIKQNRAACGELVSSLALATCPPARTPPNPPTNGLLVLHGGAWNADVHVLHVVVGACPFDSPVEQKGSYYC